jgi:DNA-binding CsgD family transcriptional regulator
VKVLQTDLDDALERLREEREAVEAKSVAMQEMMREIEANRKRVGREIQANVDKAIGPLLDQIESQIADAARPHFELLRRSLDEIVAPFIDRLSSRFANLTPREVEICNLIKNGKTTKEIASLLNVSVETVRTQRKSIRSKLGISGEDIHLGSFLASIDHPEDHGLTPR